MILHSPRTLRWFPDQYQIQMHPSHCCMIILQAIKRKNGFVSKFLIWWVVLTMKPWCIFLPLLWPSIWHCGVANIEIVCPSLLPYLHSLLHYFLLDERKLLHFVIILATFQGVAKLSIDQGYYMGFCWHFCPYNHQVKGWNTVWIHCYKSVKTSDYVDCMGYAGFRLQKQQI